MSAANAAAIRRRATPQQSGDNKLQGQQQNQNQNQNQNQQQSQGLTLPQVIAVVDKRLIVLESFMKETKAQTSDQFTSSQSVSNNFDSSNSSNSSPLDEISDNFIPKEVFNTIVTEFNNRFEILAFEINSIKDTLLKLQTYTMDVNKMLLEERTSIDNMENIGLSITDVVQDDNNETKEESTGTL